MRKGDSDRRRKERGCLKRRKNECYERKKRRNGGTEDSEGERGINEN